MYMNPTNTGSFGAAAGGASPELIAAIQRRQTQGGTTGQVTQGSASYNPSIQQPQVSGSPSMPSQPTQPQGMSGQPQGMGGGLPAESSESSLIIKALDSRLKSLSKIQGA
jgi:hypothetical protein